MSTMDAREIEFWLDFMSPYAYLAHQRLPELAQRYGYRLRYRPFDLPAAKRAAGNIGPPNVQIPAKLRYLKTDMQRWADRYGVPMSFPKSLQLDRLNKALFFAIDRGREEAYARSAWHEVWGKGGDPADIDLLRGVASGLNWNADEALAFAGSAAAQDRFDQSNREAHTRGVFGTPTMLLGDQMWWGNDRLEFLEEYLEILQARMAA